MFRTPVDLDEENISFYNKRYRQGSAINTPNDIEFANYMKSGFSEFQYSYEKHIRLINACEIVIGAKVFDFGCSWGYGPFQLARHGFEVKAFEIGKSRAEFARTRLGVDIITDHEALLAFADKNAGTFDLFFSSHVLEHVPSPSGTIAIAKKLLRGGGLFISLTPNGSRQAQIAQKEWNKWWGEVHPNFIDDYFLNKEFAQWRRVIFRSPLNEEQLSRFMPSFAFPHIIGPLDTLELGFVAVKP